MPGIVLTPEKRKHLRALAHHLNPVVMVGQEGLTPAVMGEADAALNAHGLIKIRIFSNDKAIRSDYLQHFAGALDAAPVQHIGKLLVLWRPKAEEGQSPEAKPAGYGAPKEVKVLKHSKRGGQRPGVRRVKVLGNQRLTQSGKLKRADIKQVSAKKRGLV